VRLIPLGALCALSVAALFGAGLRVAARTGSVGLERVVAAAVLAGAAAVIEALALGLIGLGSSPVALPLAAGATWFVAQRRLPAPRPRPRAEVAAWWKRLGERQQLAFGAAAGASVFLLAWLLFHPYISFDATIYHDPEIATWVQSGKPGTVAALSYDYPFGNYPVTDEVLQTWAAGIARSWAPVAVWPFAAMALCIAAGWTGLRTLRVPRPYTAAAVGAVVTLPWVVRQLNEALTDLPVLAWASATAALCAAVPQRPRLLPVAIVGFALAIGTKTTPIVPLVVALVLATLAIRPRLRGMGRWLLVALLAAFVVGGIWYLRNLIDHGSPLWPFVRLLPGADPIPRRIALTDDALLGQAGATLDGRVDEYLVLLAGGIALLLAAPVFMAVVRRRPVLIAGATAIVGFVVWLRTPGTGLSHSPLALTPESTALSETRYLIPVFATCAVTVVLAARDSGGRVRQATGAALVVAIVWNVVRVLQLPHGVLPPFLPVVAAAACGELLVLALRGLWQRWRPHVTIPHGAWAGVLLAILVAVLLAPTGEGWTARVAASNADPVHGLSALRWAADDPDLRRHERVTFAGWAMVGPLAGDRFDRHLSLLPPHGPCERVRAAARAGWLVTTAPNYAYGFLGLTPFNANSCMGIEPTRFADQRMRVWAPPTAVTPARGTAPPGPSPEASGAAGGS
jgi:hypothetical protein